MAFESMTSRNQMYQNVGKIFIPKISNIAVSSVVESSSSSVIILDPAKSAIKEALLYWCPSATFGDGIYKMQKKDND